MDSAQLTPETVHFHVDVSGFLRYMGFTTEVNDLVILEEGSYNHNRLTKHQKKVRDSLGGQLAFVMVKLCTLAFLAAQLTPQLHHSHLDVLACYVIPEFRQELTAL